VEVAWPRSTMMRFHALGHGLLVDVDVIGRRLGPHPSRHDDDRLTELPSRCRTVFSARQKEGDKEVEGEPAFSRRSLVRYLVSNFPGARATPVRPKGPRTMSQDVRLRPSGRGLKTPVKTTQKDMRNQRISYEI